MLAGNATILLDIDTIATWYSERLSSERRRYRPYRRAYDTPRATTVCPAVCQLHRLAFDDLPDRSCGRPSGRQRC